jgi:cysteinyl-tRNA synthetase
VGEVPEEVERLVAEREELRRARDFPAADDVRDRIRELGFEVEDRPDGPVARAVGPGGRRVSPDEVESVLDRPPTHDASVQWLVQGWPEDVVRGIEAFRRCHPGRAVQHVVVDMAGTDPAVWPDDVDVIPLDRDPGWGVGRNLGLGRTLGRIVLLVDGSVEPTGDVIAPLEEALADPTVGLAGPFGLVTTDLREFTESPGPDVDAVEGYLMALRWDVMVRAGGLDERFRFYRAADIEYSFRIKELGLRCVVVPLPVVRHEHRLWANTPLDERERLSKRNFNRFLDRWRGRLDLTVEERSGT